MNVNSWLVHTVSRKQRSAGTGGAKGDPGYGALQTIKARVEKKRVIIRDQDGREAYSDASLMTNVEIKLTDVFWLPSIAGEAADNTALTNAGRKPVSIEVATDKSGNASLWRAYF